MGPDIVDALRRTLLKENANLRCAEPCTVLAAFCPRRPLTPGSRASLTCRRSLLSYPGEPLEASLRRFAVARKNKLPAALDMIRAHLLWCEKDVDLVSLRQKEGWEVLGVAPEQVWQASRDPSLDPSRASAHSAPAQIEAAFPHYTSGVDLECRTVTYIQGAGYGAPRGGALGSHLSRSRLGQPQPRCLRRCRRIALCASTCGARRARRWRRAISSLPGKEGVGAAGCATCAVTLARRAGALSAPWRSCMPSAARATPAASCAPSSTCRA
jgi:hypothetical protein